MERIGRAIGRKHKLIPLLSFAAAAVLVYASTIDSAMLFTCGRYKDSFTLFCLNLTAWRRGLLAAIALISALPYWYAGRYERVLLESKWVKLGLMLSICLILMAAAAPLSGAAQGRLILTAPLNLFFPLCLCAAAEMRGKTAEGLLISLAVAIGGLALSAYFSEMPYYLYAVLAICAAASMIGERHGERAAKLLLIFVGMIGVPALYYEHGEIIAEVAMALMLYAAVIVMLELRGTWPKLLPALAVSAAALAISRRFEPVLVSELEAVVVFVLAGALTAGRWKTAAALLTALLAAIPAFEFGSGAALLLVLAACAFQWGLSEKKKPERAENGDAGKETGKDLIVIGGQLMALSMVAVMIRIASPLSADDYDTYENAARVLAAAYVLSALILRETKGAAKAGPYWQALPLQLFILISIWVREIQTEIGSGGIPTGIESGADARVMLCVASMIYTMYFLYDRGMKERPWFYVITTAALITLLCFPDAAYCAEISMLIGLATPILIGAVGIMQERSCR